jgi:cytochrome c5
MPSLGRALRACSLSVAGFAFGLFLSSCAPPSTEAPPAKASAPASAPAPSATASAAALPEGEAWLLTGTTDERFARAAKHFRGFDMAMVETGYRYGELHWAGQDQNWDYAKYQLDKIRTAVRNGLERRPKRAASAKVLDGALPGVEEAIAAKDPKLFAERFRVLTETCNACHQAEKMGFVVVAPPSVRSSVVHGPSSAGGAP